MNAFQEQLNFSIRRAARDDVPDIVRLLADDPLGSQRENYQNPFVLRRLQLNVVRR